MKSFWSSSLCEKNHPNNKDFAAETKRGYNWKLVEQGKIGNSLEVGSNGDDLVDEILDADDAELSELLLDDVVGSDGCPLAVQLDESTLVNQLADRLQVGGTPCDEGLWKDIILE